MLASHEYPVFIDLETRSACDLRAEGSERYANHPSTQLLTVAWTDDNGETYHLWMPGAIDGIPEKQIAAQGLQEYVLHLDADVPQALAELVSRPWCGHNVWGFDRLVWSKLTGPQCQPIKWIDTMPLAAAIGMPQGLDAIGKRINGDDGGKEKTGKSQLKKHSRCDEGKPRTWPVVNVPIVSQMMIGRYNVQDVKLTVDLWELVSEELKMPASERQVLRVHDSCNQRGVRIDTDFVSALFELSESSAAFAIRSIAELTALDDHPLASLEDLRSRPKIFAWLKEKRVDIGQSLAKDIIARFIDLNEDYGDADPDGDKEADDEGEDELAAPKPTVARNPNIPLVVQVLTLRLAALRVTGGKLTAAMNRVGGDGRIRFWSSYWAAHTGRWAGRGIQPHNMPRPKEGIDTWALCSYYDERQKAKPYEDHTEIALEYELVRDRLPLHERDAAGKLLYPRLGVDDAASGLYRSIIIPDCGDTLAAADLANIEARILAWLADERWLMDAFWKGADPYLAMAAKVFGPTETWTQFPDPKNPGSFLAIKKHPFRQVGKVIVLGSGYGMGPDKFEVYAAGNGIDLDAVGTTACECIWAYRRLHPKIAGLEQPEFHGRPYWRGGFWHQLCDAAKACIQGTNGVEIPVGRITFSREGPHLICTLPSARRLVYRNARLVMMNTFGRDVETPVYLSPRFGQKCLTPGLLAENVVQAVSRDVLAYSFVRCEDDGIRIVLHVHDELVASIKRQRFPDFMSHVTTPPPWLEGFPLDAEGSMAPRYAKSTYPGEKEITYRNGEPK